MNPTPTVSVVIATYNYGHYLAEAIESVFAQTFTDYEVIVVDDGSTDGTERVVQPFLSDPRLQYVRVNHVGQASAKNEGIHRSQGKWVAFLDADDLWLPEKLEKQLALCASDPDLGVVFSRRTTIDDLGRELDVGERPLHRGCILEPLISNPFICFSSTVVCRDVFEDVGVFDPGIVTVVDFDLWLRIALKHRFDYVDEPLVKYRVGHSSMTDRHRIRSPEVHFLIDRFLNQYGGRAVLNPSIVSKVKADHCCDSAYAEGPFAPRTAIRWFLRALGHRWDHWPAWRGLLTFWWPDAWRDRVRRLLGRPDWRVRKLKMPPACSTGAG